MSIVINIIFNNFIEIVNPADLPVALEHSLQQELTRANPDINLKRSLGIWTGHTPPKIRMYRYAVSLVSCAQRLYIDRGCWPTVHAAFEAYNKRRRLSEPEVVLNTKVELVVKPIENFPDFKGTLDEYQAAAVETVLNTSSQGTLTFPTGGGKTITALALLARIKQRSIICVHTHELLTQWRDVSKKFLPGVSVETWAGGRKKQGDHLTIAMVQTLSRDIPEEIRTGYGVVVQDECHHAPAATFQEVVSNFPAKYRYGLTATLERRDGKSFLIKSIFGEPLVKLGYKDVGARIILPKIIPFTTALSNDYSDLHIRRGDVDVFNYTEAYTRLASDYMRNLILLQLVTELLQDETSYILMLTKRREQAKVLHEFMISSNITAELLLGGGTAKEKKQKALAIEKTLSGENRVIIGTSIADEGLDIVTLSDLILTSSTSFSGILAQRLGRIMRNYKGKRTPRVYDAVDASIPEFMNSWFSREKFYTKHGMEIDYSRFKLEQEKACDSK